MQYALTVDLEESGIPSSLSSERSSSYSDTDKLAGANMCTSGLCAGLAWLPIGVGLFLTLAFTIPYGIAVGLGHVSAGFPYISDTGTIPPESCIFGQLLNIASLLAFATIYVRYKQVAECYVEVKVGVLKCNKAAVVLGFLATLGMSLVANFQETNMVAVHLTGAFMCFVLGSVYCFLHTWISYKMSPEHCSVSMCWIRLIISLIVAIAFICTILFGALASQMWDGDDILKWSPEDSGFTLHVVSTSSEWIMGIFFLLFFFSYIREFQQLEMMAEVRRHQRLTHVVDN